MIGSSHTIVDDHAENSQFISSLYRLAWRGKLHRFAMDTTSLEDNLFRLLAVEFKVICSWPILDVAKFMSAYCCLLLVIRYVSSANLMMSLSARSGRKSAALTKYADGTKVLFYLSHVLCRPTDRPKKPA